MAVEIASKAAAVIETRTIPPNTGTVARSGAIRSASLSGALPMPLGRWRFLDLPSRIVADSCRQPRKIIETILKALRTVERLSANPTVVAGVVAAVVGAGASVGTNYVTTNYSEDQLEANLVLEAVKVCDEEQARNNIHVFLDAGFLPRHSKKLSEELDNNSFTKLIRPPECGPQRANGR